MLLPCSGVPTIPHPSFPRKRESTMISRTLADALSVVPFAFVRVCCYASVFGRSLSRL
jgi:hypothetical protein